MYKRQVLIAIALIAGTTGAEQTLEEAYASDQEAAAPPVEAVKSVEPPAQLSTLVLGDELARSLPADWGDADGCLLYTSRERHEPGYRWNSLNGQDCVAGCSRDPGIVVDDRRAGALSWWVDSGIPPIPLSTHRPLACWRRAVR